MTGSRIDAIGKVDLNMLAALRLILSYRSVGKAATEFGLSQPAMSNTLARMRTALGDPLLVRAHAKMELTSRGEELLEQLEAILPQLERLAQATDFDPGVAQITFRIAATDHAAQVIGPSLVANISRMSPGSTVIITTMTTTEIDSEDAHEHFDLRLGWFVAPPPSWFIRKLVVDRMVVVVGAHNRTIGTTISKEDFESLPHIGIRSRLPLHQSGMDKELQERGLHRTVAVWLSNFSAVPYHLRTSDLISLVPGLLAERYAALGNVRIVEPPQELSEFSISMAWSPRVHHDTVNRWLRSIVVKSARDFEP